MDLPQPRDVPIDAERGDSEEFSGPRFAICGLSSRGVYHYLLPLIRGEGDGRRFPGTVVGILDIDSDRVACFNRALGSEIPAFTVEEGVETMIARTRPDVLLVAGPDHTHCDHILAGLRAGLRVIAEKPVVINCEQMRKVLAAEKVSAGSLTVAHNFRYAHLNRKIKSLVQAGKIGRITNVEFVYNLDTRHGASYFCRWNRLRHASGGLSIHKSVHHLDLVNWIVAAEPETVFAFGARNYFGANGAHRPVGRELSIGEQKKRCPYYPRLQARQGFRGDVMGSWDRIGLPYAAQYAQDIYLYDEEIDIEDTYSAVVRYENGVSLTYSCNFSTPWEGGDLAINGTEGRLEARWRSEGPLVAKPESVVRILPLFHGKTEEFVIGHSEEHGGADPLIRRDLFLSPSQESRELDLVADSWDGALAVAVGEAIWRSASDGRAYRVREMLAPRE